MKQEALIYNLIVMLADSENYCIDDEIFINKVCKEAGITRKFYQKLFES